MNNGTGARARANLFILAGFLALGAACADSALAQGRMYKCTDAKGKTYYTQMPPPECLGRPSEELSKSGTVLKKNEGQLTPEQQAAREAERQKKLEDDKLAQEEKRKNTALLNTYSSEKDIEDARTRAIRDNDAAIKETQKKIADIQKRQTDLDNEKQFYAKKPMPAKLTQDIKENQVELANQQGLLDVKKKQVADINAKYDEDKRRYIALTRGSTDTAKK
jgi:hypothetical protein